MLVLPRKRKKKTFCLAFNVSGPPPPPLDGRYLYRNMLMENARGECRRGHTAFVHPLHLECRTPGGLIGVSGPVGNPTE